MLPGVQSMGHQNRMRGDSEEMSTAKYGSEAMSDENFLPPIDSRWCATSDVNDDVDDTEDDNNCNQLAAAVHSRKQGEKKLSKSGRFIVNKSSMSDSFVLPHISNSSSPDGIRKSRTAGSHWSHGGDSRSRNGMPVSKSCPILKHRNGYRWGRDGSEDDDDDDSDEREFLSMSYNVTTRTERDEVCYNDVEKTNRLAKLEMNSKVRRLKTKSTKPALSSSSLADTKLPDIFCNERSPRGQRDGNNNGGADRRRTQKTVGQGKGNTELESDGGHEMDYELEVSPWRGEQSEDVHHDKDTSATGEKDGINKGEPGKPKTKRKGSSQRPPVKSKNSDLKCREWLQDSHR